MTETYSNQKTSQSLSKIEDEPAPFISALPKGQTGKKKYAPEKVNINILLISADPSDIKEIKHYLAQSAGMAYRVEHRPDFFGSADLLMKGHTDIDVILLDLGIFGSAHSREVFHRMVKMAHGIPIIVFTDREEHDMALLAMEDGASDNITRGDADTDIFKFRDAIEFSMARAAVARELEQRNEDHKEQASAQSNERLQKFQQSSAADMNDQRDQYAVIVKALIDREDSDIVEAVSEISAALTNSKLNNTILLAQMKKMKDSTDDSNR